MDWEREVVSALAANDVGLVAYLPDGALSGLIERLTEDPEFRTVSVTREEEAVGILSGAWLAGTRGALLCQSSGLATTLNAIGSLNKPARIPFLGLVSRRGDLGEFNLAQVPFGYNMGAILDEMGIRNNAIDAGDDVARRVDMAAKTTYSTEEPYVLSLEAALTGAKDEF